MAKPKVPTDPSMSGEVRSFLEDLVAQADATDAAALTVATQVEAEAGTETTHYMTPERTAQAIAALTPTPTMDWELIASTTASAAASIAFTSGIDSTYRNYLFVLDNVYPATNAVLFHMEVSTDAGSTWKQTSYLSSVFAHMSDGTTGNTAVTTSVRLSHTQLSNTAGSGWSGHVLLPNPSSASNFKQIKFNGSYLQTGALIQDFVDGGGVWASATTAINAIRFIMGAGNINGTASMYGIRNS